jgi:Ca-activated chloride channel family protein
MRRLKTLLLAPLLILAVMLTTVPAAADGIIIPDPPICDPGPCIEPFPIAQLAIKYHRVQVDIEDQVAITHVDQVFRNDNDWAVEGTYVFPLPAGAAVSKFTLWVDGEPVEGKILTKEEARKTYEEIVRNLRDPALLEYLDRGAVQASIFPIPPGGERRVELEYTQVLEADNGLIHYRYPLNTEKFSTQPLEDVSVSIDVRSPHPIRAIYSPSHPIAILRDGDFAFSAGYEDTFVTPDKDFDLFYSIADEDIGLSLITYRDPTSEDEDGFFLLLAAPSVEVDPDRTIAKDVLVVLDQSGSMDGEKFRQAQEALRYVLEHLNREDRFNIIAFSTGTRPYASGLRPVNEVAQAKRWVDSLSAAGSTDINLALLEAIAQLDAERSTILIFLTDGLPTEGVTDTQVILDNVKQAAPDNLRLFAFGVGYDVDTFLLDTLAGDHHGATTYVTSSQAIDEAVSGFYAKVSTPVLTDLELDFGEVVTYDLYPEPLPDLFAGSQLVLVGRYRAPGSGTIRLQGRVEGRTQRFDYPDQTFRSSGGPDFLPRLWATRKIGALLNQIRLKGPEEELVDQVVKLSIRYGIVTPYTSYLVTEPMTLGVEAQEGIANDAFEEMLAAPAAVSGEAAVERAAAESAISKAEIPMALSDEAADVVRLTGTRTFRMIDGTWIDTAFDPDTMSKVKVPFLSQDYFALADARPDLADAFALGEHVIAIAGGTAYEIVAPDDAGDEVTLPPTLPSEEDEVVMPEEQTDASSEENERSGGFSLPCPGFALVIGLAVLPLARRR